MKTIKCFVVCLAMLLPITTQIFAQSVPRTERGASTLEPFISICLPTGTADMNNFLKSVYTDSKDMGLLASGIGIRTGYFPLNKFESYIKIMANRGADFKSSQNSYSFVNNWGFSTGFEYYFGNIKDLVVFSANIGIGNEQVDYCYSDLCVHYSNWVLEFGATFWLTRLGINVSYTPAIVKGSPRSASNIENIPEMSLNNISFGLRFRF